MLDTHIEIREQFEKILLRFMCRALLIFKVQWKCETENMPQIRLKNKEKCVILGSALGVQMNATFTSMHNMVKISQLMLIINILGNKIVF